jgi:hypothetical protein
MPFNLFMVSMVSMVTSGSTVCTAFGIRSENQGVQCSRLLALAEMAEKKVVNGATTFSMTTFSIMDLFVAFSVKDTQHNESLYKH